MEVFEVKNLDKNKKSLNKKCPKPAYGEAKMGILGRGRGYLGLPLRWNKKIRLVLLIIGFGWLFFYFGVTQEWLMLIITLGCFLLFTGINFTVRN